MKKTLVYGSLLAMTLGASTFAQAGELSANASVTSNYIWRGLTQTTNSAAVQGGIDYAADNGFYIGTWASNVDYGADDVFSYEHDVYFGYSGETSGGLGYDFGYLYYNYDSVAEFDFSEVYGSLSYNGFSASLNLLAHTEADEAPGQDFDFGSTYYLSADYAFEVKEGLELGFHIGYHDGDFNEAFNGVPDSYIDYNATLSKDGFTFMVTSTDLDDSGPDAFDNDSVKFVISYAVDIEL